MLSLHKKTKIPCYVMIYEQLDIITKCLDSLTQSNNELEIIVIENPSTNSKEISKYVHSLGKRGLIARYYQLDSNIAGNAFSMVLLSELEQIKKSRHVIISDGDLVPSSESWLNEELAVLKRNREVFSCGVTLSKSNLPIATFPESTHWIPDDIAETPNYIEALTGAHLLAFRSKELVQFLSWINKEQLNFVDGNLHKFAYDVLHKKWSRTREASAYHLTWDLYSDLKHDYTVFKTSRSFNDIWHNNQTAAFTKTDF